MTDTTDGAAGEPREADVTETQAAAASTNPAVPTTSAATTGSPAATTGSPAATTDSPAATTGSPAATNAETPAVEHDAAAPAAAPESPAPAAAATGTVYEPGQQPQPYSAPQYTKQPAEAAPAASAAQQPAAAPAPASPTQPGQVPPAFGGPTAPQHETQPTVPLPGLPAEGAAAPAAPKQRRVGLGVAAAIVAAALIGGASGAGINALITSNDGTPASESANSAQNIVVNDTDSVNQITAVAAKASPSVVTISVSGGQSGGTGSGIILSDDGYVLTNTHVVTLDGATGEPTIQVKTNDGHLYEAELVGTDPLSDLAVIKLVDASGLAPLEFADSDKLNVGDSAIAIGAPLGLAGTVTNGIVSALNRSIDVASSAAPSTPDDSQSDGDGQGEQGDGSGSPFDFFFDLPDPESGEPQQPSAATGRVALPVIQTDAAINPGNSGGALLDSEGQLIGVNVAILSTGGSAQGETAGNIGVGFAVPSNLAKRIADEIIENGVASHGLLGATVTSAEAEGTSDTVGALISEVSPDGAAAKAGLQAGDVVTEFNGVPITDQTDLTAQVRALPGGAEAKLTLTRDGSSQTVTVTLGTFEG
ncbi:serine protease [Agromyces badenianii]|uniref:Serine protease n=1 Tax=Agromyces badenianii TaxID=2080742 RepID=A0A2S0WUI7_9MICO|nr:trypsin-like peptidase domain-containing protein [Agromyces badenianii]AWB94997.1 serine protease [Agromyces badenianii]